MSNKTDFVSELGWKPNPATTTPPANNTATTNSAQMEMALVIVSVIAVFLFVCLIITVCCVVDNNHNHKRVEAAISAVPAFVEKSERSKASRVREESVSPYDCLPKGWYKLTDLGNGWVIFHLRIEGGDHLFLALLKENGEVEKMTEVQQ